MTRSILAGVLLVGLATTVVGHAAGVGVLSASLWSGAAPVITCDTDGVTGTLTTQPSKGPPPRVTLVVAVAVDGIADGSDVQGLGVCDGRTVTVDLVDGAGAVVATGSAVHTGDRGVGSIGDDSLTVDTPDVDAALVADARIRLG